MSLAAILKGKTEKEIQLQNILKNIISPRPAFSTLSGKKAFSEEYEEMVPYSLSNPYYSTLIGMGFDYLTRFIIAKNLKNNNDKTPSYCNLAAGIGLKFLGAVTEKKAQEAIVKKYEKGIKVIESFVKNEKSDFDEVLNFTGFLAALEAVVRSGGIPPRDIKKSLIDDTNIEIINNLRALCKVFEERFISSGIIKDNSKVIFFPEFSPFISICPGGHDADLFIDGTLYDFKCNKNRGYNWIECAQIVGYYLLCIIDVRCGGRGIGLNERCVDRLAFYRGRYGETEYIDVKSLDKDKVEQGIEELRKLWRLRFI